MANLAETTTYDAGIYQLEVTDPAQGGATGIINTPAKGLANRTNWLKSKVNTSVRVDAIVSTIAPYLITAADVSKLIYISDMANAGVTFPSAAGFPQLQPFTIMAADQTTNAGAVLTPNGTDKFFDGSNAAGVSTYKIRTGQRLVIQANGSQWFISGNSQNETHGRIPAGATFSFSGGTAPNGYLKCNGAAISRTAYADLFAAIGTNWGVGDGTTTFNIPDHRGVFVRGLDEGRGLDPSRSLGIYQADQFAAHTHIWTMEASNDNLGGTGYVATSNAGTGGVETNSTSISYTGGTETTPKNNAALFIIKY